MENIKMLDIAEEKITYTISEDDFMLLQAFKQSQEEEQKKSFEELSKKQELMKASSLVYDKLHEMAEVNRAKMDRIRARISELEVERAKAYYEAHSKGILNVGHVISGMKKVNEINEKISRLWKTFDKFNAINTDYVNACVTVGNKVR